MNAEELIDKFRYNLGDFCYTQCKAYCCRKGHITISRQEAKLITGFSFYSCIFKGKMKKRGEKFVLSLQGGCPALKNKMCSIHNNPDRPKMCKEFPLFLENDRILLSEKCYGKNKFYPLWSEAKMSNVKVDYC
ncbi:MAG: YkgJ family cysteine cluster protein [Nanobdellota archaeon]